MKGLVRKLLVYSISLLSMILTIAAPHRLLKDPKLKLYDSNYCSENAIFIVGSRNARNLFCTLYLDFGTKLFRKNRSINPRLPITIHFHSNKNILKDGRRVG